MASKTISPRLNKVRLTINSKTLIDYAYPRFRQYTPFRSGNARRNTKKEPNAILADYVYAGRLEEGYSKQAPEGMSKPTIEDIRKYIFRKFGVKI